MRNWPNIARRLTLDRITGPIFDKEMRVSSRRKRNYTVRFAYLALLTLFVILAWLANTRMGGSNVFRVSRMAQTGIYIMMTIVMFQFIATHILSIIMLSNSISDEIYQKTLGVLMTTPINSFQIVMGKLMSKMLQIILLMALSLPLLAVVRVFGGVPWDYILSSLAITLTGALFAASLSLYFSISTRRAYAVIIKTTFVILALYLLLPMIVMLMLHNVYSEAKLMPFLLYPNPLFSIWASTVLMVEPRGMGFMASFSWLGHCGLILALTALLIVRSVVIVRRAALRSAVGETGVGKKVKKQNPETSIGAIKAVRGSPVIWKECRSPLVRGIKKWLMIVLAVAVLGLTYALVGNEGELDDKDTHMIYTVIFVFLGIFFNTVLAATPITSEKESRSWPILLATTLSDRKILIGKLVGVLRRGWPIWLFLFGHVLIFVIVGYIHPAALLHLTILVIGIVIFVSGSGLYFSSCFRRTTTAVVANVMLALILWAIVPLILGLVSEITHDDDLLEFTACFNPFVQNVVVIERTSGRNYVNRSLTQLEYNWPSRAFGESFTSTTLFLISTMLLHFLVGFLFIWRAKYRLRRHIF